MYSLSTTTGFPFGTHNTAELEERKKRMEKYSYFLSNYGMVMVHHIYLEIAFLASPGLGTRRAREEGDTCSWFSELGAENFLSTNMFLFGLHIQYHLVFLTLLRVTCPSFWRYCCFSLLQQSWILIPNLPSCPPHFCADFPSSLLFLVITGFCTSLPSYRISPHLFIHYMPANLELWYGCFFLPCMPVGQSLKDAV